MYTAPCWRRRCPTYDIHSLLNFFRGSDDAYGNTYMRKSLKNMLRSGWRAHMCGVEKPTCVDYSHRSWVQNAKKKHTHTRSWEKYTFWMNVCSHSYLLSGTGEKSTMEHVFSQTEEAKGGAGQFPSSWVIFDPRYFRSCQKDMQGVQFYPHRWQKKRKKQSLH